MIILASNNLSILGAWGNALRDSQQISIASSFDDLTKILADMAPTCVVLDRKLPPGKLIKAVQQCREINLHTKIVLLSDPAQPQSDVEDLAFLKAGVRGFCRTDMEADKIRKVLVAVEQGQIWIQRRMVPLLIKELSKQAKGAINISPRAVNL